MMLFCCCPVCFKSRTADFRNNIQSSNIVRDLSFAITSNCFRKETEPEKVKVMFFVAKVFTILTNTLIFPGCDPLSALNNA